MSEDTKVAEPLAAQACLPCRGDTRPLTATQRASLLEELVGWEVVAGHHLTKDYPFPDFVEALQFANRLGQLAEDQGHHPEITVGWGHARVEIWTHAIDGLTQSDFILAAHCDRII